MRLWTTWAPVHLCQPELVSLRHEATGNSEYRSSQRCEDGLCTAHPPLVTTLSQLQSSPSLEKHLYASIYPRRALTYLNDR